MYDNGFTLTWEETTKGLLNSLLPDDSTENERSFHDQLRTNTLSNYEAAEDKIISQEEVKNVVKT